MKITITDIEKSFEQNVAVSIPAFTIDNGDILGLVGNNGAGKTTLFRLILDLIKADQGHVNMQPAGTDIEIDPAKSEDWKALTGAYIDEGFLIDFLTPEEYFYFIGKINGMKPADVDAALEDYVHFMNDEVIGHKKLIRNLSAGNKQKVGIIATLLRKPQLIILDEPFNYLDPSSQHHLKKMLTDYREATGATILISSHNLQHTVDISTRIALLEKGQIIQDLDNQHQEASEQLEQYFNME